MQSHLYETYQTKTIGLLKEKYGFKNVHQIPKIQKVNLNMGLGRGTPESESNRRSQQANGPDCRTEAGCDPC